MIINLEENLEYPFDFDYVIFMNLYSSILKESEY